MRQQLHCVAKAQTVCVQMDKTFEVKNTVCVETCWQQGGKQRSTSKFFWQKLQNLFDIFAVILYSRFFQMQQAQACRALWTMREYSQR